MSLDIDHGWTFEGFSFATLKTTVFVHTLPPNSSTFTPKESIGFKANSSASAFGSIPLQQP
mgnify:CR=1 FL=1